MRLTVTDRTPVSSPVVPSIRPANRVLFSLIAILSLGWHRRFRDFFAAPLCEIGNGVLRFQTEIQLRHRESQRVFHSHGNSSGWDWSCRLRIAVFSVNIQKVASGNAKPPSRRGNCRIALRSLSHVYRSVRADYVVHPLPGVSGIDFLDQPSRNRDAAEDGKSVTPNNVSFSAFPDERNRQN